ncbi:cobalt ECF transporter T component CbiQ [Paramagnetospirillum marisnigri]|uniref:Cobalt ECF transporter T component CbiQ n=1 Tax=Paramagnetospirillum marisnigri TaxID=1285242 RepID=A0A178MKW2_9PROT|nr:cobalt ECF transporter T component CbiQ [Paramagnetospirillum marisnigri]OAN49193.1 cobalt ECF transporter T component CbiQ [Paramagnetospirillum marisnigri]
MTLHMDRLAQGGPWRQRALAEKAVLALGLLGLALVLPPWPGAALVLVAAWTSALAAARIPWGDWLRLNAAPLGFVLTGAAAVAVEIGPDGITLAADHGRAALAIVLRASAAASCLLLLAATTPTPDLVQGLRRLGLPVELIEIMLLTWRFIFLLQDAAASIRNAQEARLGWHGRGRSLRSLGLLIAQLLPQAMERARRLEMGMAARGFDGTLRLARPHRRVSAISMISIISLHLVLAGTCLWLA